MFVFYECRLHTIGELPSSIGAAAMLKKWQINDNYILCVIESKKKKLFLDVEIYTTIIIIY